MRSRFTRAAAQPLEPRRCLEQIQYGKALGLQQCMNKKASDGN